MKAKSLALDPVDSENMGVVLIVSFIILFGLFVLWAFQQKDNTGVSNERLARDVLIGKTRAGSTDVGVEITSTSRTSSFFESENPMNGKNEGLGHHEQGDREKSLSAISFDHPMYEAKKKAEGQKLVANPEGLLAIAPKVNKAEDDKKTISEEDRSRSEEPRRERSTEGNLGKKEDSCQECYESIHEDI